MINLHRPYLWPMVGGRAWIDDHSFGLHLHLMPLLDVDVEIYFAKNYWVHRGVFVSVDVLGVLTIESKGRDGEKQVEESNDGSKELPTP